MSPQDLNKLPIEKIILRDSADVERRLEQLQLGPQSRLLDVRDVVFQTLRKVSQDKNYPANAAGMFMYMEGIRAARRNYIGNENGDLWKSACRNGVELIINEGINCGLGYMNVDSACIDDYTPQPISRKGSETERVCNAKQILLPLSDLLLPPAQNPQSLVIHHFLMDKKGAAEISRLVMKDGSCDSCLERIYLSDGSELDTGPTVENDNPTKEFDPEVGRRRK